MGRNWGWCFLLMALLLAPRSARATGFISCDPEYSGVSLLGWCDKGDFVGFLHLGMLLWSRADGDVKALAQLALVTEATGSVRAGQVGLLNRTDLDLLGAQLGLANIVGGTASGLQLGLLGGNAKTLRGAQLSLLHNLVDSGHGLQAGSLHNTAKESFKGVQAHVGALYAWPMLAYRLGRHGDLRFRREIFAWVGLLVSGLNSAGQLDGAQIAGWMNDTSKQLRGFQLGIVNHAGTLRGAQVGGVNWVSTLNGKGDGNGRGMQLGLMNRADTWRGVQVGLVNSARQLHGLQVGLVNHAGNSPLPVSPFINLGWKEPIR